MTKRRLSIPQMRTFIERVKHQEEDMIAQGVNREELTTRVDALEAALDKNASKEEVAQRLDALEATLAAASSGFSSAAALNLLNEIFGTGVPPV